MKSIKLFLESKTVELKNPDKVYWEGWTVKDFFDEINPQIEMIMSYNSWKKPFTSKAELKEWIGDNQPYYKKPVKELVDYYSKKYNIK